MTDFIPIINDDDIIRIIQREFPSNKSHYIQEILNLYIGNTKSETNRIWAALLKLSNGNINRLLHNIDVAKNDFRNVLSWAETPMYFDDVGYKKNIKELAKSLKTESFEYLFWINRKYGSDLLKKLVVYRHIDVSERKIIGNGIYKNDLIETIKEIIDDHGKYPNIQIDELSPIFDGCIVEKKENIFVLKEYREYSIGKYKKVFEKTHKDVFSAIIDFCNREFTNNNIDGIQIKTS